MTPNGIFSPSTQRSRGREHDPLEKVLRVWMANLAAALRPLPLLRPPVRALAEGLESPGSEHDPRRGGEEVEEGKRWLFVMIRDTPLFLKGQKVWASWTTGALAAPALGRYKKTGRWVNAWVHWADEHGGFNCRPDCRVVGLVTVTEDMNHLLEKRLWAGRRLRGAKAHARKGGTSGEARPRPRPL